MSKNTKKFKTVETLEPNDCRWPIGDPRSADFHFCGAGKAAGHPYCELHWRMSFVPKNSKGPQALPHQAAPAVVTRRAA